MHFKCKLSSVHPSQLLKTVLIQGKPQYDNSLWTLQQNPGKAQCLFSSSQSSRACPQLSTRNSCVLWFSFLCPMVYLLCPWFIFLCTLVLTIFHASATPTKQTWLLQAFVGILQLTPFPGQSFSSPSRQTCFTVGGQHFSSEPLYKNPAFPHTWSF